ncbi:MAG: hypothetical protein ACR2MB_14565 [Acidimicrobiales bacterium]
MVQQVTEDLKLAAIGGETRTIGEWTTTFQLVTVVLDPYTRESAWLLATAARFLANFRDADCRVTWTVTADERDAQRFLGPLAKEYLTFADPERAIVKALDIERLPALVHIRQDLVVVGQAEGWNPPEWERIGQLLGKMMSWSHPQLPASGDPGAFPGSPAKG